jgi:transposase
MLVSSSSQAEYMAQIRGVDRERCLVVPVDVGKRSAMALVADHCHEVVVDPFTFELNETGVSLLLAKADADAEYVGASSVRFGVEAAGHYHRGLVTRLDVGGRDVVEVNPAIVKDARGRIGQRRVKTDIQDCLAMAEVLIDGLGHSPTQRSLAMATQAAWAAQRRRKVAARGVLIRQLHAQVDLAFPHLSDCFSHGLDNASLRIIMGHICDPARVVRLGPKRFRAYVVNRGVQMWRSKADQVVEAAVQALAVHEGQRRAAERFVARDVALLELIEAEIAECDRQLASVLAATPAGVLTSIPGVGVTTASYYGAALGDPHRFRNADAAYRYSGLSPTSYESAGKRSNRVHITREGSVPLRHAIMTLGHGVRTHEPDFAHYYRRLVSSGKPPLVALVAVGHRAHRLAFAMMRTQTSYDPHQWVAAVEKGRAVKAAKAT